MALIFTPHTPDCIWLILEQCCEDALKKCIYVSKTWKFIASKIFRRVITLEHPLFIRYVERLIVEDDNDKYRHKVYKNAMLVELSSLRHPLLARYLWDKHIQMRDTLYDVDDSNIELIAFND
jgi:hypothetical protein